MVDAWLQRNLQAFTSRRCSEWLDLAHVNHLMAGNVLRIPDVTFFVEEACSGIQSAYWLVAASALFVIAVGRKPFWGCLLLLSSIFWALASNALRVGTVAWTYERMGVDLSSGWRHELLGLVAFSLALTM
jgi:exosortase